MEYYEVAAKWWKEQVCNLEECNSNNMYKESIERFEKSLAEFIKNELVKEGGCLVIASYKKSDDIFKGIAAKHKISIKDIPEEFTMFITRYMIRVVNDFLGNNNTIYEWQYQF